MRYIRSYQNGNRNSVTKLPKEHRGLRASSKHHFRVRRRGVSPFTPSVSLSLSLMCDSIRPNCYRRVGTRVCAYRLILWWDVFHSEGGGWFQTRRETTHSCQYCKPTVETVFFSVSVLFSDQFIFSLPLTLIYSVIVRLIHYMVKSEVVYVQKKAYQLFRSKKIIIIATSVSYRLFR